MINEKQTQNNLVSITNYSTIEKDQNYVQEQSTQEQDLVSHDQKFFRRSIISDFKESMTINSNSRKIISSWQFWGFLLALTFGGVGFTATSILLRLPSSPNCSKIYLPFASATNRIYCGQLEADKKTVEGLLNAIDLVAKLPENHPLRAEIDRHLTEWGNEILAIGETEFQAGKLDEAINIATKIPSTLKTYSLVEAEIDKWRNIWKQGKDIEIDVEKQLRLGNWNQAFSASVNLLNIRNDYWRTTKYQETVNTINLAREESKKLDVAYLALRRKGIDNLLTAIEVASKINSTSYAYQQASKIIEDATTEIVEYAQNLIEDNRWSRLSSLAEKIPDSFDLKKQANDWNILANAGTNSTIGTVSGLEMAIGEASNISSTSSIYPKTQELVKTWQLKKEDLVYLDDARSIAQPGDVNSLNQAIIKAKLITNSNPLYGEAQREIENWQRDIEVIEDQPNLDRAKQLAQANNVNGWQEAINQASQIPSHRALYSEAQALIQEWTSNIQQEQDQPILDQAISLGNSGNYQAAIDTALKIPRGRILSRQAQSKIRSWRREINAQSDLNQAYQVAEANTPDSLLRAINIARGVPSSTSIKGESRIAVNRWAEQLLAIARSNANYGLKSSLEQAIRTAELIPYGTSAYSSAREQITSWKNILNPPQSPNLPPLEPIEDNNFPSENL